jgi:type IX secretion system PorP/SprF family membrane protein
MYRYQWVGFDGAPVTTTLSGHVPMRNTTIALGLLCMNEKIGVTDNTGIYGNYAYRVKTLTGHLAFGLKAGFDLLKEDDSKITSQQTDNVFNNSSSYLLPNFGLGIYYYTSDYFIGGSIPAILSYRYDEKVSKYKPYNNVKNDNILLTGGMSFKVNENLKIRPSTLLKYQANSPFQYDLNCYFILLNDNLWVGTAYRANDAIVGLLEFQLNTQVRFGYSYDYSLGPLSKYNSGSHEILLRYEFRYKVNAVNPKYF